jgi:hypothetical protein
MGSGLGPRFTGRRGHFRVLKFLQLIEFTIFSVAIALYRLYGIMEWWINGMVDRGRLKGYEYAIINALLELNNPAFQYSNYRAKRSSWKGYRLCFHN